MATKLDARQSVLRSALGMVGSSANDSLDTIFPKIDAELAKLFEDRNFTLVSDGTITFVAAGTSVSFSSNIRLHVNSKVAGGSPTVIDLTSTSRTLSANGRMVYAVINRSAGTATITDDSSTLPAQTSANQEIVLIAKRVDATDGTKRVYFRGGFSLSAGQTSRLGTVGTVYANEFSVADSTDTTKKIVFQASGGATAKTLTLASAITLDRTWTIPDATDTAVGKSTTDLLANKTMQTLVGTVVADSTTAGATATIAAFTATTVRLTNAGLISVSGIPAGTPGQVLILENMTGLSININNDDGAATAANRIYTGAANVAMSNKSTFLFTYDAVASRWMLTAGGGSVAAFSPPVVHEFTSPGTTTGYLFTVSAANASVGDTYTNNGQIYTVLGTVVGGTRLFTSQPLAPTSSGTLTKSSGAGDATITFSANIPLATYTRSTSPAPIYIRVRSVGAGGGGAGSGTANSGGAGSSGTDTIFGLDYLLARGGSGGSPVAGPGGDGGTSSKGVGASGEAITGGMGGAKQFNNITVAVVSGGNGGSSALGGAGSGGFTGGGSAGAANTGGGGGGAGTFTISDDSSGGGGGGGGWINVLISSPLSAYVYAIGAGGAGGAAGSGTNAATGGPGGSGGIIVEEYFQ